MAAPSAYVTFPPGWTGADVVFFDCDSTLSSLEGIDELAERAGVNVADLTRKAMAGEISMEEVYGVRLEHLQPSAQDFAWLANRYSETIIPGARETIAALQAINIRVCVISGGLFPAVKLFAEELGVVPKDVYAVPYPLEGEPGAEDPLATACAHPLARNGGKPQIVAQVAGVAKERRMLVGDGISDLEAGPEVGMFVGFGAVESRVRVVAEADHFLPGPGLWEVALLAAGPDRLEGLRKFAPLVYESGVSGVLPTP
ncbi:MAG: HAD-IB family phosphatase [Planctomycetes bacterium]|nr:HAD-IB family phosphatase [Planctomycetota bacterium]